MFEMYVNKLENLFSRLSTTKNTLEVFLEVRWCIPERKKQQSGILYLLKIPSMECRKFVYSSWHSRSVDCIEHFPAVWPLHPECGIFENIQIRGEIVLEPAVADRVKMNFWFTERFFRRRRRRRRPKTRRYKLVHCALINNSVNSI